ncbi:hypothetical protein NP493_62g05014 [Ridgeia piscesae]|uniref:CUB domain-containing protein n=1 Tax=Ridgeia piscesae TaxID=27915 RepID=A0AAD9PA47_RIDPI|nr:hypothetical protein NP493_62g05014 [Ridgeia piscesae]
MYGRMRPGRCVQQNYGYIGCHTDVTRVIATRCSGRSRCEIANLEAELATYQNCPADLKVYLDANYTCIKVATDRTGECQRHGTVTLTSPIGYIANNRTTRSPRGCSWVVEALPGQHIELTLMDFTRFPDGSKVKIRASQYCVEYVVISEQGKEENVVVCDGDPRVDQIYRSRGNVVAIRLSEQLTGRSSPVHFLIKYEALGCPYPPLSSDYRIVRQKDGSITVTCNATRQSYWTLVCRNRKWIGNLGNCSAAALGVDKSQTWDIENVLGIHILTIGCVAVIVCFIIVIIGVVCIRRQSRRPHLPLMTSSASTSRRCVDAKSECYTTVGSMRRGTTGRPGRGSTSGEYTHIWQTRRPTPVATPAVPECATDDPTGPCSGFSTFKPPPGHIYARPSFACEGEGQCFRSAAVARLLRLRPRRSARTAEQEL